MHSRPKGLEQTGACVCVGEVLWNYSSSQDAERKPLDRPRKPHKGKKAAAHACTQISSDKPGPGAMTPASAAVRSLPRPPPLPPAALRYERTAPPTTTLAPLQRHKQRVTHLVRVIRVELGLHVLLLLLRPHGLAALASSRRKRDGPPLPLTACKHTAALKSDSQKRFQCNLKNQCGKNGIHHEDSFSLQLMTDYTWNKKSPRWLPVPPKQNETSEFYTLFIHFK